MGISGQCEKFLNDEECFFLWSELGSITRVVNHLKNRGDVNPKTSRPFTRMSIWHAALRHALNNLEETKPYFLEDGLPEDKFDEHVVKKAMIVYSTSKDRFLSWIKENDFEDYKYLYADKFGLEKEMVTFEEMIGG